MDTNKEEELRLELEKRFQEYHEIREMVLNLREEDRMERNNAKEQQIQQYEQMQVSEIIILIFSVTNTQNNNFVFLPLHGSF